MQAQNFMNIYEMCSRDNLVTLRASDRSRCGAVLILKSLAQPSHHSVRIGSLCLWRGANFDMARTTLSGLWKQIALVVARCSF
jgi:hypothetical protein